MSWLDRSRIKHDRTVQNQLYLSILPSLTDKNAINTSVKNDSFYTEFLIRVSRIFVWYNWNLIYLENFKTWETWGSNGCEGTIV